MFSFFLRLIDAQGADIVCNCVNIEGTEMPSSLAVKQGGTLVYFSMATSFGTGVLSTDGTGKGIGAGGFLNNNQ